MEKSKIEICEINMRRTKTKNKIKINIEERKNYNKYTSNGIKKK